MKIFSMIDSNQDIYRLYEFQIHNFVYSKIKITILEI